MSANLPQSTCPVQVQEVHLDSSRVPFPSQPKVKIRRLWEVWPGNNQFCLDGRIMVGPKGDRWFVAFTWVLFLGITVCYFVNVVPYLWIELTPALPLLTSVLLFNCLVFMTLTTTVDPGIIPRRCVFELSNYVPSCFVDIVQSPNVKIKLCTTCRIVRPERSHHCPVCNNCVEVFDHHCPFLNNCIGKRNYAYFLILIINAVLYGLSMVAGLVLFQLYDKQRDKTDHTVMENTATVIGVTVALSVVIVVLTLLVTVLCLFHLTLCYSGETTKEHIRGDLKPSRRHCWTRSPTWFDPRQVLTDSQIHQSSLWK